MTPHTSVYRKQHVATYWILLDPNGHRLKALPYRLPYADLMVSIIVTADEKFTLAEETVTWKQPTSTSDEPAAIPPPEEGWRLVEDRGESVVWRRPNTIAFSKRDIAEIMRERKRLRGSIKGDI